MGHRRFLPSGHKYRTDRIHFDGSIEKAPKPSRLSGSEILEQVDGIVNNFGKYTDKNVRRKRGRNEGFHAHTSTCRYNWKKLSIFFQLPYWKDNLVPHNLDIMHIEKNVLENILWTLLGVAAKTKDNLKSRLDLQELNIRKSLHPQREGDKIYLPSACFTLSKKEKDVFLQVLKNVKVPDGYASNISKCVNIAERNIFGLKSHDCHILMQQLLPVALRRLVPKHVCKAIINLCEVFKQLYSKVHTEADFEDLEERVALVLCELEKIFPPSFFDVMEHLPIHLPEEAKLGGPVQFRSMYPIERYLCTLKNYVRTRSHPEGSIAEGYLAEECMTFCSMYLSDVESKLNRPNRNDESGETSKPQGGRSLGKEETFMLGDIEWTQAHRYVINSLSIVDNYKRKHLSELQRTSRRMSSYDRQKLHAETFHDWFKSHVNASNGTGVEHDIQHLAAGPSKWARRYTGYVINGLRFHTKMREIRRKTQNSGVFLSASTNSFSSSKDKNPKSGDVSFYGVLKDIIEVRYTNYLKFVLFKCDWVDYNVGLRRDEFNFTLVNFNHLLYRGNRKLDEPFILASQAQQAWYIQDPVDSEWHVALKMTPRAIFNVDPEVNEIESIEDEQFSSQQHEADVDNENLAWVRADVDRVSLTGIDIPIGETNVDDFDNDDANLEDEDVDEEDFESDNSDSSDDDDFFEERTPPNDNEND
ncbi:uncharacterized protein LOC131007019 isoform X2 [Salvia miltiorrhiza]|nr:uncharacterized protein LOC131007019 isoform X2 [Salvia miltiorrhiza]